MRAIALGLSIALLGGAATAQGPANWTAPTEPFRIGGNLYYVGTAGLGAYLLTSPQGHVLIDGAKIAALSPHDPTLPVAPGELDGRGRILIPSLSDVHVHLDSSRIGQPFRPRIERSNAW